MAQLTVFDFMSLNGFYKGANEDISWNLHGSEEQQFSAESLAADNILLFGRVTYQMMAAFWPMPDAIKNIPQVARGMNKAEKIVFSNTMQTADWHNTRVMSGDIIAKIQSLKQSSAKNMTILGSGNIVSQFAEAGLIDTYQVMIYPVALQSGTSLFNGIKTNLSFKLISARTFNSGTVLLTYQLL